MTPHRLAALHRAAFTTDRAWSEAELAALLAAPFTALHAHAHGFALSRTVAGETELLTLAVDPAHQRQGIARHLLADWLAQAAETAEVAFLEVAADNLPAIGLYRTAHFSRVAARPGYYQRAGGQKVDALVFQRALTRGHTPESAAPPYKSG